MNLRWFRFAPIICVASACLPPSEVGRFARTASETTSEFTPLARDMYSSCLRFEAFKAQRSSTGWYDNESLRNACASRDSAVTGVLAANRVLSAYLSALARLADDKTVSTDAELTRLAMIAKKSGMGEPGVNAVAGLAKYLTSSFVGLYRRQKLHDAIASQNGNVVFVTAGLRDIINLDYRRILSIENRAANDFYRAAIADNRNREPLASVLVLKDRDERSAELRKRADDLDAYVRALDAVRAGHQKLYENRDQIRAKELSAELVRHAETLERIGKQLEKAF